MGEKMTPEKRDKMSLIGFLIAAGCFFLAAILGMINGSDFLMDLGLGLMFLLLALSYHPKIKDKKIGKKDK